jgi:radical SAM/Cys-rich protein
MMSAELVALIPSVLERRAIRCLDLTGGAPELHPDFRSLVRRARDQGVAVIDRCNLTILSEPGQDTLAQFLADQRVGVIASLPCYSAANVDQQRGDGVFERSLEGLRMLNALGYGSGDPERSLDLVFNPQGPSLPPAQELLEADYKRELGSMGIRFDRLLTLANMPIQRFFPPAGAARSADGLSAPAGGGPQPRQSRGRDVSPIAQCRLARSSL